MDIKDILIDLEVIKQINENDKLSVCKSPGTTKIFVDRHSYISSATRWYCGYNREESVSYLEKLIENITKASDTIQQGNHINKATSLKNGIESAINGFKNLQLTYNNDSITIARIIICINNLDYILNELKTYINDSLINDDEDDYSNS
tara:strand:- start:2621 stop:3064 length:444 start_codon:yes stop_codon:yes gene_type:complete